ncbi:recombinase family protein [Caulobacter soli]|uniref:recombinase family protein n=1 Tax=Caulobacter soli TaxID=2708539 RepID=UPI0013ECBEBE|nr:recombinase family protein [Caulobacter soli]
MRIGYARVSTEDQTTDLQLDALKAAGCHPIFQDTISGASRKRAGLEQALATIKPGGRLVVWKLDRLGRDFRDLNDIADELHARGAHFISLTEGIDTSSPVGEVIFRLLSVFADFERGVIIERTRAGLRAARARGVRLGRRPKLTPEQVAEASAMLAGKASAEEVAQQFGVDRSTVYRLKSRRISDITFRDEEPASQML